MTHLKLSLTTNLQLKLLMQRPVSHKLQEDLLQSVSVVVLQIWWQQEVLLGVLILWILEQQVSWRCPHSGVQLVAQRPSSLVVTMRRRSLISGMSSAMQLWRLLMLRQGFNKHRVVLRLSFLEAMALTRPHM
jgi:hypothetical protein